MNKERTIDGEIFSYIFFKIHLHPFPSFSLGLTLLDLAAKNSLTP